MSGFEDLIRDTIAKQGEPTHAVRTRVYASARSALERMIAGRAAGGGEDAQAAQQREALENAIRRIEAEHAAPPAPLPDPVARPEARGSHYAPDPVPYVPPAGSTVRGVDAHLPVDDASAARPDAPADVSPPAGVASAATVEVQAPTPPTQTAPSAPPPVTPVPDPPPPLPPEPVEPRLVDPGPLGPVSYAPPGVDAVDPAAGPAIGEPVVSPVRPRDARAEERARREAGRLLDGRPRRKPWVLLLLWTIVLAGLATAGWWGWNFGRSTIEQIAIPPAPSEIVAPPPRVGEADANWVTVFDPAADIASVVADGGTSDVVDDPSGKFLRITAEQAGTGVTITVPPGVMQSVRGGTATFEVTVRAAEASHSFAVMCDFGTEAGCGRRRFEAGTEPTPFLFDADMTEAASEGTILFVPDVEGQGRAIDVERIRVRVG